MGGDGSSSSCVTWGGQRDLGNTRRTRGGGSVPVPPGPRPSRPGLPPTLPAAEAAAAPRPPRRPPPVRPTAATGPRERPWPGREQEEPGRSPEAPNTARAPPTHSPRVPLTLRFLRASCAHPAATASTSGFRRKRGGVSMVTGPLSPISRWCDGGGSAGPSPGDLQLHGGGTQGRGGRSGGGQGQAHVWVPGQQTPPRGQAGPAQQPPLGAGTGG